MIQILMFEPKNGSVSYTTLMDYIPDEVVGDLNEEVDEEDA